MISSIPEFAPKLLMAGMFAAGLSGAAPSNAGEAPVLGHEVFGNGPEKVLVLHDWMGDGANYNPLKPYLDTQGFTYVFADLRGYGASKAYDGDYTAEEISKDTLRLADALGWKRFHLVGHSMSGMAVQRLAIDDWTGGARRLKSVVAITPVSADGYPATDQDREFLWNAIHNTEVSEMAFSALTGGKLGNGWARTKTRRNLETSNANAMKSYYAMWLDADFSADAAAAQVETPMRVIGGRNDLPGFLEPKLRDTFGAWYPNAEFRFITDAGHYPMQETPAFLASLIQEFLTANTGR